MPLGRGEFDLAGFVAILRAAGYDGTLFVELANMHPDFADEDAGVAEGVAWLRKARALQPALHSQTGGDQ